MVTPFVCEFASVNHRDLDRVSAIGMSEMPIFDGCVEEIERAYDQLGYDLGWRFLSVSRAVLEGQVKIAFVTLNPGGNQIPVDHPTASCENGPSYLVERWRGKPPGQAPLQVQVQKLFEGLVGHLGFQGASQQLMERSLIGHYVPFRSPRFADLPHKEEALSVGRHIWSRLLHHARPRLIICLGREAQGELRSLLEDDLTGVHEKTQSFPSGWGNYKIEIDTYEVKSEVTRLLYLPHLSTFKLFTTSKCRSLMDKVLRAATAGL
jgi:hypothetical protein